MQFNIYFHHPCFDGIASAVLATRLMLSRRSESGEVDSFVYHGVNYHQKKDWDNFQFEPNAIVVDFMYHPRANGWYDHHETTFGKYMAPIIGKEKWPFEFCWDFGAKSCARIIFTRMMDSPHQILEADKELIFWADKLDSADYSCACEAVDAEYDAIKIMKAASLDDDFSYTPHIISVILDKGLKAAGEDLETMERFQKMKATETKAKDYYIKNSKRLKNIAFYHHDPDVGFHIRFLPYKIYTDCEYALNIIPKKDSCVVSIGRTPFKKVNNSPNLGLLCKLYGGGGHRNIGSINVPTIEQAQKISDEILGILING